VQRNVKRMLAYSSINHAGFILLGVWAGTIRGTAATLFYVMTYAPIVIATFAVVTLIGGRRRRAPLDRALPRTGPTPALARRRAGGAAAQPTRRAAHDRLLRQVHGARRGRRRRRGSLALVALIGAAIAAFFYLRWAMALYADDDVEATRVAVPPLTGIVIGFGGGHDPLRSLARSAGDLAQHATVLFTP
jgi:NADH-quinone oxidoreductase subunit N